MKRGREEPRGCCERRAARNGGGVSDFRSVQEQIPARCGPVLQCRQVHTAHVVAGICLIKRTFRQGNIAIF